MNLKFLTYTALLLSHQNSHNSNDKNQTFELFYPTPLINNKTTEKPINSIYQDIPQNEKSDLSIPHPKNLIDPKTGKPYRLIADAWDEFFARGYRNAQIVENLRIKVALERQQKAATKEKLMQQLLLEKETTKNSVENETKKD